MLVDVNRSFVIRNKGLNESWKEVEYLNISKRKSAAIPDNMKYVDAVNIYYIERSAKKDEFIYYKNTLHPVSGKFVLKTTTVDVVQNILNNLKSNSTGSDGINLMCCPLVLPYVTHIIKHCLSKNIFPNI